MRACMHACVRACVRVCACVCSFTVHTRWIFLRERQLKICSLKGFYVNIWVKHCASLWSSLRHTSAFGFQQWNQRLHLIHWTITVLVCASLPCACQSSETKALSTVYGERRLNWMAAGQKRWAVAVWSSERLISAELMWFSQRKWRKEL